MALIYWLNSSLVDWMAVSVLTAGVMLTIIGLVGGMIPVVSRYVVAIRILAAVLLVAGGFLKGSLEMKEYWSKKVTELEQKLAIAEAKSSEVNVVIETREVEVIKHVDRVVVETREVIKEIETVINANCSVAPEVVHILNEAAAGRVPETPKEPTND